MSERITDHHLAPPDASQASYKPQYRAEPQQALHYPGMQYQLYPAAAAAGMQWQPPARRRHKRMVLLAVGSLLLVVLTFGFRLFDLNLMPGERNARASAAQDAVAARLVESDDPAHEMATVSSLPAAATPDRVAATVPPGTEDATIPEAPVAAMATASLKARETSENPSNAAVPAISAIANIPERQALLPSVALNIPDTRTAVAAPISGASSGLPAQEVNPVRAALAPRKLATAATCSEALRAMQLCGEQARGRR